MKLRDTVADMVQELGLPGDTVSALCQITLTAGREAVVDHHGGLLGYGDDYVEVRDGPGRVRILGSALVLRAMDRQTIIVTGKISGVEYA